MNRVLSREQIRNFDRYAIDTCHVPSLVLMENAGRGAANVIEQSLPPGGRLVVVCGVGNNGGDGFVVARHLIRACADVSVWLVGDESKLAGDALLNYRALRGLQADITPLMVDDVEAFERALAEADVIVDAMFGTGLDREVRHPYAAAIRAINQAPSKRIALDLPSGLDANTGAVLGVAVEADETITFGALKLGMLTPNGAQHCGTIHVASLGVPESIIGAVGHTAEVIVTTEVAAKLGQRPVGTHKHAEGNVLIVAGGAGKVGASMLVGRAALRAGAGLATIATWPEAVAALESQVLEVMTAALDDQQLEQSLQQALSRRDAVAIGPGFGHEPRSMQVIDRVVLDWDGVKVVDADAITAFAGRADELAKAKGRLILTPHAGELAKLLGTSSAQVEADRFAAVRDAVHRTGAIVVLKGAHTVVAVHDRPLAINASGNPALATAGAGDVLCGIMAAFACTMSPEDAAMAAVHVHGLAADAWVRRHGSARGMLAGEITEALPVVFGAMAKRLDADAQSQVSDDCL